MAAPTLAHALEYPGRLSYGCTDFSAAWPHGGTGLGFCDDIVVQGEFPIYLVRAEEWGNEPVEAVVGGEAYSITCLLRDGDEDAINQAFLNTEAGTVSQHRGIVSPGTNRAGYLLSAKTTVVAFTPESLIEGYEDMHDMVVFYKAMPAPQATMRMRLRLRNERLFPLAFYAIRTSTPRSVAIKRRADLSNPS